MTSNQILLDTINSLVRKNEEQEETIKKLKEQLELTEQLELQTDRKTTDAKQTSLYDKIKEVNAQLKTVDTCSSEHWEYIEDLLNGLKLETLNTIITVMDRNGKIRLADHHDMYAVTDTNTDFDEGCIYLRFDR
jgi:hypothetical protein